ncbi:MAG: cyclic nucleotide-binding domain-containing protein [Cytophagaceae bacterium]|nr:cyclic nucleotide-binding domain-containing protein [Cytophagaceae bacterium]
MDWLVANGECREYPAEALLYKPEDPIDHFFVMLQGRIRIHIMVGGEQQEVLLLEANALGGVLPFSRLKKSRGFWQALEPTTLLALHRDKFRHLSAPVNPAV